MAKSESYVDTSAFIALLDRSDSHHLIFARLFSDPGPLVTSPLVIAEGQGWFLKRYDSGRGIGFLNFIKELTPLKIVAVGEGDLESAGDLVRTFSDQPLTLTDALGLHLMAKRKISDCWSTDRHLGLTGKKLVIHN